MNKLLIQSLVWLLLPFSLLAQSVPVDSIKTQQKSYKKMIGTSRTLKIVGGGTMALGLGFMMAGASKQTSEVLVTLVTLGTVPYDEDEGNTESTIGGILFVGGVGLLIGGIITSSKAKKMKAAGKISLKPYVPPAYVTPKLAIAQQGFSLAVPIGK